MSDYDDGLLADLAECDGPYAADARSRIEALVAEVAGLRAERGRVPESWSESKFPPGGIADLAWSEALGEYPDAATDSAEVSRTYVCNTVLHAFNPPDDDIGYESIITDAIEAAALFIEAQPCTCGPDPWKDGACARCDVLGRVGDEVVPR